MKKIKIFSLLALIALVASVTTIYSAANQPSPHPTIYVNTEATLRSALTTIGGRPADSGQIQHEIVLTEGFNVIGNSTINIPGNRTIRISGEHTITRATPLLNPAFFFNLGSGGGNAHLILDGPTLDGAGNVNHGIRIDTHNNQFTILKGSMINFNENGIRATSNGNYTTVTLHNANISNNGIGNSVGMGVRIEGRGSTPSKLVLHPGAVVNNNGTWGVWLERHVDFEMHGGIISNNPTGVRLEAAGGQTLFNMYDGLITQNQRGVLVGTESQFNLHGGVISHNHGSSGAGVRVGGTGGGTGHMTMYDGTIEHNISDDNGGGIQVARLSTLTMHGGEIRANTALNNGGGVHLITEGINNWPTFDFYGGTIAENTTENDGGGIWVDWTRVAVLNDDPDALPDLRLGDEIGSRNIHSNTSHQLYAIIDADRARLEERGFSDQQISLWNNHQINYSGIPLNYTITYGVRQLEGTLEGKVVSKYRNGPLAPSPAKISGNERIDFVAFFPDENYVPQWTIGVSEPGQNPVFFTQEQIEEFTENGYISLEDNMLVLYYTGAFLFDDFDHIYVFVSFYAESEEDDDKNGDNDYDEDEEEDYTDDDEYSSDDTSDTNNDNTSESGQSENNTSPQTGEPNRIFLIIVLVATALGLIVAFAISRSKKPGV